MRSVRREGLQVERAAAGLLTGLWELLEVAQMAKIPSFRVTRADRGHDCTCIHRYFHFLEVYMHM